MNKILTLQGNHTSVVLCYSIDMLPQIVYWGEKVTFSQGEEEQLVQQLITPVPQAFLDNQVVISLLPLLGEGNFQANALAGNRQQLHWAPKFGRVELVSHELNALVFVAYDDTAQLKVQIELRLNSWDILEKQITLTNLGDNDYQLDELLLSLPISAHVSEMIQFHGRWIHEFQPQRSRIEQPCYLIENLKGRTSNDNPPLLLVGNTGFNYQSGMVYGFHLGWSGNHKIKLSVVDDGRKLVQSGERLLSGEINLRSGESYTTPCLYASYSTSGINGISHNFHRFIRQSKQFAKHVLPYRPIHINTWEAMYFQHDITMLYQLVDRAASLGIERFVLDDGWFYGRHHERAGLGDWFVDQSKYPNGLQPLIDYVENAGLQFGLWFEPEMVNPDSDLFRNHPEWCLQLSGYQQRLGRYQYVLNLANSAAYDYIKTCLVNLLTEYSIGYIKWDMNRDLVQAGDNSGHPSMHEQVLATYRLLAELNQLFPEVEIESCSSGGARVDLGILRYTNRVWTSDCNDPYERQTIQEGCGIFFPPELLGSHFGPEQAHTTNRLMTLDYRFFTAFFANLGFEQNLLELSDGECNQLREYISIYKQYRHLVHSGDLVRIDTHDVGQKIYGVISSTQQQALFAIAQNDFPQQMVAGKLRLPYLVADKLYRIKLLNAQENTGYLMKQNIPLSRQELILSGKVLAHIGLQLPIMHPQSILLISFDEVK